MRRLILILTAALPLLPGQQFEVASIKLSDGKSVRGWTGGPGTRDPERYTFGKATLLDLIVTAYHVDAFQVSSKARLDQPVFDLDAKVPAGATREQFRAMLQNLLAERFHCKAHLTSKDFPAYELVTAKGGLKLKESPDASPAEAPRAAEGFPSFPPGRPALGSNMTGGGGQVLVRTRGQQEPISELARALRCGLDDLPVVDRTGLTGKYDFTLEYACPLQTATSADAPPLSAPDMAHAVEQQLGLQLIPKKLPFDVVVIDSIDKLPTAN